MKKIRRKLLLVPVLVAALLVSAVTGLLPAGRAEAAGKTGAGLAAYAQSAYSRGAQYVWGGVGPNGYDCSGLIYAYAGGAHNSEALLGLCTETGSASSIPDIPGLLLWRPGHVGVYIGGGMSIDARGTQYGIIKEAAAGKWQKWGKLSMLSYSGSAATGGGNTAGTPVTPITPNKPSNSVNTNNNTQNTQTQESSSTASEEPQEPEITDLVVGMQGEAVTRIQTRLSELGYYYEGINDYFDLCVSDAVTAFQEVNEIHVNGNAYVAMQELAYSDEAKENPERGTIKPGLHSSVVAQIQDRLVSLGYLDVEPTGFYGDATKEAVMAYQQQSGLEPNGILTAQDLDVLYSEAAVPAPQPEPSEAPSSEEPPSSVASSEASSEVLSSGSVRMFDDVVPTVAAATVDGADGSSGSQNNSGVFAMVLVLLCAGLTAVFFVVRKNKKSIQSFGVAVIRGVSQKDWRKLLKKKK